MSYISITNGGSGGGGTPIETITGNDGIIVPPTGNNVNLVGGTSTVNNVDGISTSGNIGTSTETVSLTNRITGAVQTTDDVTLGLIYSFNLGTTPGTYTFFISTSAYNVTDALSASYHISISVRTTGAAAVLISGNTSLIAEEGTMAGCYLAYSVSGNTVELDATGLFNKTINWVAVATYTFAS